MQNVFKQINNIGRCTDELLEEFANVKLNKDQLAWVKNLDPDSSHKLIVRYTCAEFEDEFDCNGRGYDQWIYDIIFVFLYKGTFVDVEIIITQEKDKEKEVEYHLWLLHDKYSNCSFEKLPPFAQKVALEYINDPKKVDDIFYNIQR